MISRYASAISMATLMTFALLFVMQLLISMQPNAVSDFRVRNIVRKTWMEPPPPPLPVPKRITPKDLAHVPIAPRPNTGSGIVRGVGVRFPDDAGTIDEYQYTPQQYLDGPLVVMIRVAPIYPPSMRAKGIEGYVLVQFDVTTEGRVANIRTIESSHSGFIKAASRAAARFKYKPRVVDGVPLASTGIRNLFRFRMNDD